MTLDSLRARVVSGFFWLAATKFLGQAMSWVITLAVVRLLAPEDYGLMGMAVLVNGFLLLFNELGLGAAIIQKPDLTDRESSDLRWVVFFVNVGLFVVLLVGAPAVGHYFREPALAGIVRAMGLAFIINGIGAPSGFLLSRHMAFKQKAQAEFIGNVVGSIVTLVLALMDAGVWCLVAGYLVMQGATNALYVVWAPIRLQPPSFAPHVRTSLHFGSQVAVGKILWWVSMSADSVVVGRMLGTIQLGYYGLAVQFASIPLQKIVSLITQVALPSFSALQQDRPTLRRYYLKLVGITAFLTFPIFVGLLLASHSGVRLFLTEKWLPIIVPLQILSIATCLRAIETLNTPVLIACNRPGIPMFNSLLQAIVLPLAFAIGARWGLTGVAAAWLVAWPLLFLVVTAQTLQVLELPVSAYLKAVRHPVTGAALMILVVVAVRRALGLEQASAAELIATVVSGAASYISYYALCDQGTLRDVLGTLRVGKSRPAAVVVSRAAAAETGP